MWRDTETHTGDEKIVCHKMKLESSLYLGYQQEKKTFIWVMHCSIEGIIQLFKWSKNERLAFENVLGAK